MLPVSVTDAIGFRENSEDIFQARKMAVFAGFSTGFLTDGRKTAKIGGMIGIDEYDRGQWATWKITVEVNSTDAADEDAERSTACLEGRWEYGMTRSTADCIAMDFANILKFLMSRTIRPNAREICDSFYDSFENELLQLEELEAKLQGAEQSENQ
jgi:hypothetical protein